MSEMTLPIEMLARFGPCVLAVGDDGVIAWMSDGLVRLLGRSVVGEKLDSMTVPMDRSFVALALRTNKGDALPLRGRWVFPNDAYARVFIGAPAPSSTDEIERLGISVEDFPEDDTWLNYLIQADECAATQKDARDRIRQLKLERAMMKEARDGMQDARRAALNILTDVAEAKRRADQAREQLEEAHTATRQMLAAISSVLIGVDAEGRITAWNVAAEQAFDVGSADAEGRLLDQLPIDWDGAVLSDRIAQCRSENRPIRVEEIRFGRPDGTDGFLSVTFNPVTAGAGRTLSVLIVAVEITEQRILHGQLAQAQKLESIGQLAAGIAHEINTPIQYVGDNARFLQDSVSDLISIVDRYAVLLDPAHGPRDWNDRAADIRSALDELDVEFLKEEVPKAIAQSLEGVERVSKIVRAMKDFSHPDSQGKEAVNLNGAIESTITVARNEWKYVAEMVTDFDSNLPPVSCLVGEFNQVILNLIINAAHAIEDVVGRGSGDKGTITVSTRRAGELAEIRIADTGTGIPEEHRSKVFDHFFTTKEVGKGTGQGLAIAYAVITEKHGGRITLESEMGKGTTFTIRIPIESVEEYPEEKLQRELAGTLG